MRLIIIRHGDPDYENDSLTEKGWREAHLLAERIAKWDVKAFYCSPLGRAQATAKPTLEKLGRTAETKEWLEEFCGWVRNEETGRKHLCWDFMPSYWTNEPDYYDKDKWVKVPFMQSGNVEQRYKEVCQGLDEVIEKHGYKREGNCYRVVEENRDTIVLFCHFGVESVLLSHLLGVSPMTLWHGTVALPSSVTTLVTEERQEGLAYFRCNGFGDLSHLYAADEPASFSARFCETYSNMDERH